MTEWLERVSLWCGRLTGLVVVVMAAALVGSLLISIFFRYVVGSALSWPEEISLMLFTWIVLLTGSLGVREGFHARLTIVTNHLPSPLHKALETATTCLVGTFGGFLLYSGYDLVQRTAQHLTPTLRLPLDLVNYSAPVCGALIMVHSLSRLLGPARQEGLHE